MRLEDIIRQRSFRSGEGLVFMKPESWLALSAAMRALHEPKPLMFTQDDKALLASLKIASD